MPGPVLIIGHMKVAPENAAKFREAANALIAETRQETGCLGYNFSEDIGEPGLFNIAERWADEAAVEAHNKTAHLAAFMAALPGLQPTGIRLARYQTAEERMLFGS